MDLVLIYKDSKERVGIWTWGVEILSLRDRPRNWVDNDNQERAVESEVKSTNLESCETKVHILYSHLKFWESGQVI